MKYIKKAIINNQAEDDLTKETVTSILRNIELGREKAAIEYGIKFDQWNDSIIVSQEDIENACKKVPSQIKSDIQFAHERVEKFAIKQKESLTSFETELSPGLWCGQRLIPIKCAGAYVPGGRYAHVASAIMSLCTAKVAGVQNIVACSSPSVENNGIHPAILYTMNLCGADHILALGGVQAIAAMTFGLFSGVEADILVGPGNKFVAEAKRQLFGRVGIDMFAGPTEILIIADKYADPEIVAVDLVGQLEHGIDSPVWLISTDLKLAEIVLKRVPELIDILPQKQKEVSDIAWRTFGEIVVCQSDDEAIKLSDEYAPEHLEIMVKNVDFYLKKLKNYGSLFIGEETTVAYGDKCSGTNHVLPTKKAARYTGGLSVHKFIKVVTTQRMTQEANREVGAVTARISRTEGMEAHALTGDFRLKKYFD